MEKDNKLALYNNGKKIPHFAIFIIIFFLIFLTTSCYTTKNNIIQGPSQFTEVGYKQLIQNKHSYDISQAKQEGIPILIYHCACLEPNIVNGVDVLLNFFNTSHKTIKYVYFEVLPYNAVDDIVYSEINNDSYVSLKATGPIYPDSPSCRTALDCKGYSNVWYNSTIEYIRINQINIIFMDGEEIRLDTKEKISKCFTTDASYFNDCRP